MANLFGAMSLLNEASILGSTLNRIADKKESKKERH